MGTEDHAIKQCRLLYTPEPLDTPLPMLVVFLDTCSGIGGGGKALLCQFAVCYNDWRNAHHRLAGADKKATPQNVKILSTASTFPLSWMDWELGVFASGPSTISRIIKGTFNKLKALDKKYSQFLNKCD
mgnify:CR=1 FL=1